MMKVVFLLVCISLLEAALPVNAQPSAASPAVRDGSHDFDFNLGTWHTHIKRFKHVLAGTGEFVELDGTVTTKPIWGGKAAYEEIEADGPDGHWEGMTLFLYNPASRQWSQSFVNSQVGILQPPTIGERTKDRVQLVAQDTSGPRSILVKGVWSDIQPNSHTYSEFYSDDAGASWKPAFIGKLTRVN